MKRYALLVTTAAVGGAVAFQGSVQLQGTTPGTAQTGHLHITGTAKAGVFEAISTAPSGITYGGDFRSASTSGRGVPGNASATTGATYGGLFQSASNGGRAVAGIAGSSTGTTYGGFFSSLSNQGRGVYGQATSASGTTYGVYGKATSPNGYGVYSEGRFRFTGPSSGEVTAGDTALFVENTNTSSIFANGIKGASTAGSTTGVTGISSGYDGIGVEGVAAGSGPSRGGSFTTYSSDTDATGVYGVAVLGEGVTYGVWGRNGSNAGYGVVGISEATTGVTYGTYGRVASSAGWSLFAQGRSGGTGTKSFRIDHPFDPENKYLLHYSSESPVPQNFYSGNAKTDAQGRAWVELPEYFGEINKNFKYQLTVLSEDFVQAVVSKKVEPNRFQIRTCAPNTEVPWRVEADRNDLYVRNRPTHDVELKEGAEKGTYQHPEFYGHSPERGMNYHPPIQKTIKSSKK